MTFLILARDAEDAEAPQRREEAYEAHIKYMEENILAGKMIYGGALMDEQGQAIGSMIVVNFDTDEQVEAWLDDEPFAILDVWANIEIIPCKTGKAFEAYVHQYWELAHKQQTG